MTKKREPVDNMINAHAWMQRQVRQAAQMSGGISGGHSCRAGPGRKSGTFHDFALSDLASDPQTRRLEHRESPALDADSSNPLSNRSHF